MADFTFSNKSGSSNFAANGDKNNEIFGDLLLNRTELEAYLTSLRRRQRSSTPPANPNTGDIWECSTTGGGYTANVVYRYNGSAWVESVAAALNVPNRNTVLQGKVDISGNPALFEAGTGLAVKLNATATTAVFAFMNGNSATTGAVDLIASVSADSASFWSSLPTNSTVYLYVDYNSGTPDGGFTTITPVYQSFAPDHAAGLHWFDFNTGKVWSSDGSTWTQRNRICVGTATTDGTGVTAVNVYPYNVSRDVVETSKITSDVVETSKITMSGKIDEAKGTDISSASSIDLGAATGNFVDVTGTTTITALGTAQAGTRRVVRFADALILTYHATSLILPTGANITTAAGDTASFVSLGSGSWACVQYQRYDGTGIKASQNTQSVRQTVVKAAIDAAGNANYISAGSGLAVNIAASANNIVITAANGVNDIVGQVVADTTISSLTANATNYLFADIASDGTVTLGKTTLAPVYQAGGTRSIANGQCTFNIQEMSMTVGNGSVASQINRVFIGEAVCGASSVTSVVNYALMGRFYSQEISIPATKQVPQITSHNIGVAPAYAKFYLVAQAAVSGYSAGDVFDTFTVLADGGNENSFGGVWARNTFSFFLPWSGIEFMTRTSGGGNYSTLGAGNTNFKYKFIAMRGW